MIFFSKSQERDIYEAMSTFKLRPGQALLLLPSALRVIAGEDKHGGGPLPGKFVFNKEDWNANQA